MAKMFYSQFVMFVYDIHDHKLWNTARCQEPAFHKASDLTMIHFDRRVETLQHWAHWNINSLMVKYVQIWNSILSQKKNGWWPGIGSWIASFRIPIISIAREGLFVKCIDWSLLYTEQHPDNLRKITLQMI